MSSQRILKVSIVDVTFGIWAAVIPIVLGDRLVNGDGDIARHIAIGERLLRNGSILHDQFSFTARGEPVIAKEWLSQLAYALFHQLGGIAAVAIGAGLVIAGTYALVVLFMRLRGVDPLLAYLTGMTAALLGSVHWLARPHLFTLLGVTLLLFLVQCPSDRAGVTPKLWVRVWMFAPLFLVWANLHGGFIIGFAIIAAYLAGDLIEAWKADNTQDWFSHARYHAAGLGVGFVASLVNPLGILLHYQGLSTIANRFLMSRTYEWLSPDFHLLHGRLFLLVISAIVAILAVGRRRLPFPQLCLLLLMLAAALFARRNIPLFVLTVLPVLAVEYNAAWGHLNMRGLTRARRVLRQAEATAVPGRWLGVFAAIMLLLGLNGGRIMGIQAAPAAFSQSEFPVEAVRWARQAGLEDRMFHDFAWGGYIIYGWPEQKVFVDWTDAFSRQSVANDYLMIQNVRHGWNRKLDEYGITIAMVPVNGALAYALERNGWRELYRDGTAVILRRNTPEID